MNNVLTRDLVLVPGKATTKDSAILEAGGLLVGAGAVTPAYVDAMFERETQVSTYMGNGLAIPHGTNEAKGDITRSAMCLIRYDQPIDWDGNPARVVVGIAGAGDEHLEILSKVAILFSDSDEVEKLLAAPDADSVYALLQAVNS